VYEVEFHAAGTPTTFIDDNIDPDVGDGPQEARTPFADGEYPGAVGLYQQRLILARTDSKPNTVWTSQTGALDNLSVSRPLKDTDAITATIAARQVNEIRHIVPMGKLFLFTSGAEWLMNHGDNVDVLTPASVQFSIQSQRGCSNLPPLVIGSTVLYLQRSGQAVRDLSYSLEVDGYSGDNRAILAGHLFRGHTLIDWAYQEAPWSVVWAVRDDGVVLSFTYVPEHDVWAWATHDFGTVLSVASVKGDLEDDVYFLTQRMTAMDYATYIEKLGPRMPDGEVAEAYFLDHGVTYDAIEEGAAYELVYLSSHLPSWPTPTPYVSLASPGHGFVTGDYIILGDILRADGSPHKYLSGRRFKISVEDDAWFHLIDPATEDLITYADVVAEDSLYSGDISGWVAKMVTTISGLDYLEGRTVSALADGAVVTDLEVLAGSITLPGPAGLVHIGIPYESVFTTLPLEVDGAGMGKRKLTVKVGVRFADTVGGAAGDTPDDTYPIKYRADEVYSDDAHIFSGYKEIPLASSWERTAQVTIKQTEPLPMTILAVSPEVSYGK